MKTAKRNLIALAFILSFINVARSQQLSNTYWMIYDSTNFFTAYAHFDPNTLAFSVDNINYTVISSYTENGNLFEIVDIVATVCAPTDTGHYTFLIQNDTLRFTHVVEPCTGRSDYLDNYYFVAFTTGIESNHSLSQFQIFPNPFDDRLNITLNDELVEINLYDVTARKILTREFKGSTSLNTEQLTKGIYIYEIRNKNQVIRKGKVVKE